MAVQRRKKEPKADLHVTINPLIIEYFETLRAVHKREYSEYVEEKLLDLINEIAPEQYLELKLTMAEKEVDDIKQAMKEVKLLRSIDMEARKAKEAGEKQENEERLKLERFRDEKYRGNFESLKRQAKINKFQWDTLQTLFRFKNKFETEDYVRDRLREDGVEA